MFETENKHGKKYLFKPAESKRGITELFRADIQEAVYKLQKEINPQGAIPCFTRKINNIYGAVQEKIEVRDNLNIFNWQIYGGDISQTILDEILQEYVVDWASGNFDAHGGNFLIDINGNVRGCDKEQALRYLLDEDSLRPDLDYNPNKYYGQIEPIYNTIFKRFIDGKLENINFEIIYEALERLDAIPDEQYLGYFKSYVEKLPTKDKSLYFEKILERKHNASLYIKEFLSEILRRREEKKKIESTKKDLEKISETQIMVETESEEERENRKMVEENFLNKNLKKYGITKEEWQKIEKYKGSDYFLPTTLLHSVDLFKYNMPSYSEIFTDWFSPEKAIDSYCKIYSAMCKFAKRYDKDLIVNRVGSELFYEEMKKTEQTESMLSFSNGMYYKADFEQGKNNPIYLYGQIAKGTPCINFNEFLCKDPENEVLIPPFLGIEYKENEESKARDYQEYEVIIKPNREPKITKEERDRMQSLRKSIIDSNIPERYYTNWYNKVQTNSCEQGKDAESEQLRKEFLEWQTQFKEYLKFRFREIENEINYPEIKPINFLSWTISRGKEDTKKSKEVIETVKNLIGRIINSLNKDDTDR